MLPHTTPNHYITGMTALNIPSPEDRQGDRHFHESFYGRNGQKPRIFVAGEGEAWNTNTVLANFGIYECSATLRKLGLKVPHHQKVYTADHCRAILDMLYRLVKEHASLYHLEIDEWIDSSQEKKRLINAIKILKSSLTQDEWKLLQTWLIKQNISCPHYTLSELLATSDYSQPQPADQREWIDAPTVGKELI